MHQGFRPAPPRTVDQQSLFAYSQSPENLTASKEIVGHQSCLTRKIVAMIIVDMWSWMHTILHGKLHDKNGIHCYQAIEINHTLKKKKRLSQETMDINQISLHQLFLQKKTLEVRFSDAFSSTFCTISYQINWNNVIHSSHTRLLLVKINGVGMKKKCFKVELIFQFSWRSMPVVHIIPGTS